MADVVDFPWISGADLDPDRVLEECKGKLGRVVVMGWEKPRDGDGEELFYTNTSFADGGDILWLLEMTKERLMANAKRLREERG